MSFYEKYATKFTQVYAGDKLRQLEAKNGGSILDLLKKTKAAQTPTLIIGLGGLGGVTLNQIKKKYIEFIKDDQGYIRFLAMDFDKNWLANLDIAENGGWLKNDERCKMIANVTACARLIPRLIQDHMDDPAQQWIDQNLDRTTTINEEGAKGVRQVGRLILSRADNYNAARNAIKTKIEALHNIVARPNALTVVLVAGISGGTGSGTIVDISYMVRDVAAEVFGGDLGNSMNFDAILYTPEVQFDAPGVSPENLQRNFTAAMKEINAFFRAEITKTEYNFPRQGKADGKLQDPTVAKHQIFSSVSLVQGYDSQGGRLPEEAVIDTVASYVINLIGDFDTNQNNANANTTDVAQLSSVLNNESGSVGNRVDTMLENAPSLPRDTVYGYRTFGFKTLTFPVEELMTILANRTMMALSKYFDKQPARNELKLLGDCNIAYVRRNPDNNVYEHASSRQRFDMLLRRAGVTQQAAENAVDGYPLEWRRVKGAVSIGEITREIPNISTQVATSRMDGHWKNDVLDNLFTELKEEMKENGPYAALRLCERMAAVIDSILTSKLDANSYITKQLTEAQEQVSAAFRAIKEAGIAANKRTLLDSFRTSLIRYWGWKNRSNLLETVFEILNELNDEMTKRHNKVFDYYVGAFGAIAEVLSKDSTAAIETAQMSSGGTTVFSASMMNINDVNEDNSVLAHFIKHWLTPKYISKISDNLIESMLEHEEAWQVGDFDGVAQMKDVFKKQFAGFANKALQKMIVIANMEPPSSYGKTIDDILDAMDQTIDNKALKQNGTPLSDDQKWDEFNKICRNWNYPGGIDPLTDAARKIYTSASAIGQCATLAHLGTAGVNFQNLYAYQQLFLMADMPQLNAAITQISGVTPMIGNFPGIFNLVAYYGVPLYFLKGIEESQQVYASCLDSAENTSTNAGMHMDASEHGGWSKFPPLVNNRVYRLKYAGTSTQYQAFPDYRQEDKRLGKIKQEADICLTHGLISEPVAGGYRILFSPYTNPMSTDSAQTQIQDALKAAYLKRIHETAAQVIIPDGIVDPETAWDNSFQGIWVEPTLWELIFEEYRTRILKRLENDSAGSAEIQAMKDLNAADAANSKQFWQKAGDLQLLIEKTELNVQFDNLEKCSVGNYLLDNQGGLYRTIRLSKELREKVSRTKTMAESMSQVLQTVGETVKKQLREAAVGVYAQNQLPRMVNLFVDSILSGHIQVLEDDEKTKISVVFYDELDNVDTAKLLVSDPSGNEFPTSLLQSYEQKYWLYGVFSEFMCILRELLVSEGGQTWFTDYQKVLTNDLMTQAATEEFTERKLDLKKEAESIRFSTNPLGLKKDAEKLDETFRIKPPKCYKHLMEMDFTDKVLGDSFAGKIKAFYMLLQEILQ